MKSKSKFIVFYITCFLITLSACKKEPSLLLHQPPIAAAGPDQTIQIYFAGSYADGLVSIEFFKL